MSKILFGTKVDFLTIATPSVGYVIGYDSDGILKQKDDLGIVKNISSDVSPNFYTTNSTMSSNRTVNMNLNDLHFSNINQFKINSDSDLISPLEGIFNIISIGSSNIEVISGTNGNSRITYSDGNVKFFNEVGIGTEPVSEYKLVIYSDLTDAVSIDSNLGLALSVNSISSTGISSNGYTYGGMFSCSSGYTQSYAINALGTNGSGALITNGFCRFINNDDPGLTASHFFTGYGNTLDNVLFRLQNGNSQNVFDAYGDRTAKFYNHIEVSGRVKTNSLVSSTDIAYLSWNSSGVNIHGQINFNSLQIGDIGLTAGDLFREDDGLGNFYLKVKA